MLRVAALNPIKRLSTVLAVAGISFLVAGCATPRTFTEQGASREASQGAKITCESEHTHTILNGLNQKVFIAAIDGKSTYTIGGSLTDTEPYAEAAYVKPGRHYLDLKYRYFDSFASGKVWFDAEAGGSYIIRRKVKGYAIVFWVEDLGTGKVVGGIPGGEPSIDDQLNTKSPPL